MFVCILHAQIGIYMNETLRKPQEIYHTQTQFQKKKSEL